MNLIGKDFTIIDLFACIAGIRLGFELGLSQCILF